MLNNRQEVIDAFKTGIFPYIDGFQKKKNQIKDDFNKFIKYIEKESKGINYDLFKECFSFSVTSALAKKLYETKNKNKNNELVEATKNRWSSLKDEIRKNV